MRNRGAWIAIGLLVFAAGCGAENEIVPAQGRASAVGGGAPPPPAPAPPAPQPAPPAPMAAAPQPAPPPAAAAAAPRGRLPDVPAVLASDPDELGPDAPPKREVAEAGVGVKGRGYGGGLYTEPIRIKFSIEQRLVFQDQIPHALALYKAEHDRAPRSHEEFMKEIIQAGGIVLPELPKGDKYFYDPKLEQLLVEHPAQ